jgi:hypothetical protein
VQAELVERKGVGSTRPFSDAQCADGDNGADQAWYHHTQVAAFAAVAPDPFGGVMPVSLHPFLSLSFGRTSV